MLPLYIHRNSIIHRVPAGAKLLATLIFGSAVFFFESLWLLISMLLSIAGLYVIARLPLDTIARALRPVFLIGIFIFALQLLISGPVEALTIVLRIFSLILLTSLVTLTTRFADMLDVLTRISRPLARIGVTPPKLALTVGLTIRFIPALLHDLSEIRQAKLARRAKGSSAFGAGPLVIKILRMTDAIGNAIAARGFENRK